MNKSKKMKITFNAPVILTFALICLLVLVLDKIFDGALTYHLFSTYRSSLLNPLTYFRFFGHAVGHTGWTHFFNNMVMLLVVGPVLEEKYGSSNILLVILVTAFVIGLINFIFFPYTRILGASGVIFAFILLSSMAGLKEGEIPMTFILVAFIYLGQEVFDSVFVRANISYMAHIVGGILGAGFGYSLNRHKVNRL